MELIIANPDTASLLKQARLSALRDTPSAFCASLEREEALTDEEWRTRAGVWTSDRSIAYIARENANIVGLIAGKLDTERSHRAHLLSMWVAPSHRGTGLGSELVSAIEIWARTKGASELFLEVTPANQGVMRFYARNGFVSIATEPSANPQMRKPIA